MIPPYELQKRFGEIVSSKVNAINNLKQKNINLIKVRDLLLPRLMSGKISVE